MSPFASTQPLIVTGVSKTFTAGIGPRLRRRGLPRRQVRAVQDVSFDVAPGEIFGLIGANGSGKSTLIRILSSLVLADEGEVRVFGYDVERDSLQVRQLINRVSADPSFFRQMSALENLLFYGRAYGLRPACAKEQAASILDRLGLDDGQRRTMVKELSRGQQQKIAVARAFLTSPVLMLLDEPTTGLDPRSKRDVQRFIREVQRDQEATIILTTHDMGEAEALCDRIAFIVGGRIVAEGTSAELRRTVANGQPIDEIDLEDVFMVLTGRKVEDDEEEEQEEVSVGE
ncbi:MAG: ABC transporter ATP-binding protein [Acidimicrobiia bacterium]|nr:ABC transporter ATP-binding protein [Acidimicrobiia bacterium]